MLCGEIKALYGEAAQADDPAPSKHEIDELFWRQAVSGRLLRGPRAAAMTSENSALKTVGDLRAGLLGCLDWFCVKTTKKRVPRHRHVGVDWQQLISCWKGPSHSLVRWCLFTMPAGIQDTVRGSA